MRIGLDATPLLGRRTGVGTYVAELVRQLAPGPDELTATAFTGRGLGQLAALLPPGVRPAGRPVPARLLHALWAQRGWPPVEALAGPVEVFHATNFVLPPLRRAAGVLTVHDLAFLRHPDAVTAATLAYTRLVPQGIARSRVVCVPSAAVAQQLQDAYAVPAERVVVTHLGVDEPWFQAQPADPGLLARLGLPQDYLVAVGTLEPRKNLAAVLAGYRSRAGAQLPPLVLVGGAGWGAELDLDGLQGRVHRPGHLPIDQLRQVVAGARLLVFPSLDEGFGLPPLEALACGVPVLASDIPVCHEVLGDQARFVDPHDTPAIGPSLEAALDTPAGTPASRRARARGFTWQRFAEATRAAYQRALEG